MLILETVLLVFYFLMNLNYPAQFAQFLGLLHILCLSMEFPNKLRSAAFDRFRETITF